jgi:release factor glutamine methyltransferase
MSFSTTVPEWLETSTEKLKDASIETPRLDCLVLLEDLLLTDRANLLAHPERALSKDELGKLDGDLARRIKHEPLAYIRGKEEFYGRDFIVDQNVLVPRPESEDIINELLGLSLPQRAIVADIGTGSGALGITAALEIPEIYVSLYDVNEAAIAVAKRNVALHRLSLPVIKSDLLGSIEPTTNVFLVNLPYVPAGYSINKAVKHEPKIALYAGKDGMDLYEKFWQQIKKSGAGGFIITESLPSQHPSQNNLAGDAGFNELNRTGLIQVFSNYDD